MNYIKITLLFIGFILVNASLFAGIITVNNNNPSPGQYNDLQTAIDAAQADDTLLIHRSATSYGNATITKRLTLIGEGALANKMTLGASMLGNITLTYNTTTFEHASKSQLIGLSIANLYIYEKGTDVNFACDSVVILYSKITTLALKNKVYGLTLKHSLISNIANGFFYNCKLMNNIIYSLNIGSSEGNNNLFTNNLFMLRLHLGGGIVANNIFYANSGGVFTATCRNVVFSNNILFNTAIPFNISDFTTNGNTSINNQFNVDPLFIYPIAFNNLFGYTHTFPASGPFADFHLQPSSPAINAGSDGTDLGIYGGTTPWRDGSTTDSRYRYFPLPDAVPVITGVTVQNPVVNQGGTLQIQINATTQP